MREEEGLVEDQQANTAGIPFAQPDDEDEWMSYVDLGDIEASWVAFGDLVAEQQRRRVNMCRLRRM